MSLVRIDVRIKASLHEQIKQLAVEEGKKESEMIRELIDIGIAYKDAKKNPSAKQLSAFEEEVLKKLCSLTAASNKMITNQYDIKDSPYKTMQELVDSIKESASIEFNKFKERVEQWWSPSFVQPSWHIDRYILCARYMLQ